MVSSNSMGVSDLANFIPELWANTALGYLPNYLNLARTVNRDWDNEPAKYGDTIHIPERGSLSANQKVADTSVTKQFPQSAVTDVTLDQQWECTFAIEDIARAQANQDVMRGYIEDGVMVLAEKVETVIAALYTGAGTTVASGATITDAKMLEARKALIDNKLNKLAPRYGYFDPSAINDMLQLDKFTRVESYGKSGVPVETGELGTIYGIKIFESQLVQTSGSPTSTYHALVYGKDAITLAMRPLPQAPKGVGVDQVVVSDPQAGLGIRVSSAWDKDYLALQVTLDVLFGKSVLRDEHLVDVQHT